MTADRLRPTVRFWLAWLAVSYGLRAVAGFSEPDRWADPIQDAYRIPLAIADARIWGVAWVAMAILAVVGIARHNATVARVTIAWVMLLDGPWVASLGLKAVEDGLNYLPATLAWASPIIASGALLLNSLLEPAIDP